MSHGHRRRRLAAAAIVAAASAATVGAFTLTVPTGTQPRARTTQAAARPQFAVREGLPPGQTTETTMSHPAPCSGRVSNSQWSDVVLDAQLSNGQRRSLQPGETWAADPGDPVVGYQIPYGGLHVSVSYFDLLSQDLLRTDELDLAAPTSYAVDPCHEAIVVATRPS